MDTTAPTMSSKDETRTVARRRGSSRVMIESSSSSSSSHSARTVLNSVLAGYAAGISGTLVGHPFDSVKVWLQTQRSCKSTTTTTTPAVTNRTAAAATAAPASHATRNTAPTVSHIAHPSPTTAAMANTSRTVHTVSTSGTLAVSSSSSRACTTTTSSSLATATTTSMLSQVRASYAGVAGPLLTVGLVQSINFAIYDSVRRALWHRQQQQQHGEMSSQYHQRNNDYLYHDSLTNVAVSSSVAGAVLAFFTSPMLITKTQQQTVPGLTFRQALQRTMQRGMFVGFAPHFLAETAGRAVYFCSYEALKRSFLVQRRQRAESGGGTFSDTATTTTITSCSLHERMISAALSGILCWSLIFPLDALRCRMYAAQQVATTITTATTTAMTSGVSANPLYNCYSTVQMAQHMYQTGGGITAFYRGFGVTVVRAGPVAAAVLPVYDWALEQLSS